MQQFFKEEKRFRFFEKGSQKGKVSGCIKWGRWMHSIRVPVLTSLIFSSVSLGCSTSAPGSAGGGCATAEAGTAEEQHGQRWAGRRKCELCDIFLMCLIVSHQERKGGIGNTLYLSIHECYKHDHLRNNCNEWLHLWVRNVPFENWVTRSKLKMAAAIYIYTIFSGL